MIYRHKKTGTLYNHVAYGRDCTNGERDGTRVVIYKPRDGGATYVRDYAEHLERFDPADDEEFGIERDIAGLARPIQSCPRKIIQIAVTAVADEEDTLYALCDDGTVWWTIPAAMPWRKVRDIPQEEQP